MSRVKVLDLDRHLDQKCFRRDCDKQVEIVVSISTSSSVCEANPSGSAAACMEHGIVSLRACARMLTEMADEIALPSARTGYTKHVTYQFEAGGQIYEIYGGPQDWMIEETRKNGQEDTHLELVGFLVGGRIVLEYDEDDEATYGWNHDLGAIQKALDENGVPEPC